MSKFWVLEEPDSADADRRHAEWNKDDIPRYELIQCPINPGHRRAGAFLSTENVILPNVEPYDFVWPTWACLVQGPVLELFRGAGFKGYDVAPAIVRYARSATKPPKFWQLIAKGSAGRPSLESGSRVLRVCPGCGLTDYSRILEPAKLIDESQWDGSDFFRVEPFLSRIFVIDRVVQALRHSRFEGWGAYSLEEMKEKFDIAVPGES